MEKKNYTSMFILIFVVIAMLIAILGGKIIIDTIRENKENSESDVLEAEKLLSKYKGSCRTYITSLTDSDKILVAINNTKISETKFCSDKTLESVVNFDKECNCCRIIDSQNRAIEYDEQDGEFNVYNYSELLKTIKTLFGQSETLSKNISINDTLSIVKYVNNIDSYIFYKVGICIDIKNSFSTVKEVNKKNDTLKVTVETTLTKFDDSTEEDTYEYLFKQENGNYYLAEITKVK